MHVFFSGIGGAGIGPLALIAKQAGYEVSGSDATEGEYTKYLTAHAISNIHIGQTKEAIAKVHSKNPIDWLVYSSALPKTNPNHPELQFAKEAGIKSSKREELINKIIEDKNLKMIAIAGTHGKTTTTAMVVWLFKQLGVAVSYSLGAKLSFGEMGQYEEDSQYFVYEADEYDHNFLAYKPFMSLISGIDWDHPDIYPSREQYYQAFRDFIKQSQHTVIWHTDAQELGLPEAKNVMLLHNRDFEAVEIKLAGEVNRRDAWLAVKAAYEVFDESLDELVAVINKFPGLSRRWEEIAPNIYSDSAHTPAKIRGALQLAHEQAGDKVVVIYEGLHNLRQHFIKDELKNLFDGVKKLYIVPSYLAREDPNLPTLSPDDLKGLLSEKAQAHAQAAQLDDNLKASIKEYTAAGDTVLALTAGGAGSLDEWLRLEF